LDTATNIRIMIFRWERWVGHTSITRLKEVRNACKTLVGKREGKGRYGWEDKIKVDLQRGNGISWATKGTDGRFLRSRK
jgi:hypothetical protein